VSQPVCPPRPANLLPDWFANEAETRYNRAKKGPVRKWLGHSALGIACGSIGYSAEVYRSTPRLA